MEDFNKLKNVQIDRAQKSGTFIINPAIYELEVVKSAAYILMDRAYIFLDKGEGSDIKVEVKAKENFEIEDVLNDFNKELLNYSIYKAQSERNKNIREILLQKVMMVNLGSRQNNPPLQKDGEEAKDAQKDQS